MSVCLIGIQMGDRLYAYYLNKDWLFYAGESSSQLINKITAETNRLTGGIIMHLMYLNSKVVLACLISVSIILYDPIIAFFGLAIFAIGYLVVYKLIKDYLSKLGTSISIASLDRFRLINEGFGGIRDIILLDRRENFIKKFEDSGKILAKLQSLITAFGAALKYFIELLAFGVMISLVLVLLKIHGGSIAEVLPILSVYALAGFKIIPAFRQIYSSMASIKGNMPAFDSIRHDLKESFLFHNKIKQNNNLKLDIFEIIQLKSVFFRYPNRKALALENVSLQIKRNSIVGFVGESGSGKSTAADIILGLIVPEGGNLLIDDKILDNTNMRSWQKISDLSRNPYS